MVSQLLLNYNISLIETIERDEIQTKIYRTMST